MLIKTRHLNIGSLIACKFSVLPLFFLYHLFLDLQSWPYASEEENVAYWVLIFYISHKIALSERNRSKAQNANISEVRTE